MIKETRNLELVASGAHTMKYVHCALSIGTSFTNVLTAEYRHELFLCNSHTCLKKKTTNYDSLCFFHTPDSMSSSPAYEFPIRLYRTPLLVGGQTPSYQRATPEIAHG